MFLKLFDLVVLNRLWKFFGANCEALSKTFEKIKMNLLNKANFAAIV